MKPQDLKNYLKELYPDIVFREGTNHTQASVNGGISWAPLGPRHAKDIKRGMFNEILKQVKKQLDIGRTEARSNSPEKWPDEVRNLNLLRTEPKISIASDQGRYNGIVMHVDPDNRYCVQKTAPDALIVHNAQKLQRVPVLGEVTRIDYVEGRGAVAELNASHPKAFAEKAAFAQGILKTQEARSGETYLGQAIAETKHYVIQKVGDTGILHLKSDLPSEGKGLKIGGKENILIRPGKEKGTKEILIGDNIEATKQKNRDRGQERGR